MVTINKVLINGVKKGSIAEEIGLKKGDYILSINSGEFIDILDYKFNIADSYVELEIEHEDGIVEIYEIEKYEDEDLGIIFESELIDKPKNCHNKCIFCFMDQLPKHVRETLIFKDDDYRLSFFSGNYITLTNMKQKDIDRIIKYRMSPINISVHATDEKVRKMMLNNKFAGKVLKYMDDLYKNNIHMNAQIVLCKGINDGDILKKTIEDLSKYFPVLMSICIVPVGLSKNRDGLYPLELLTKDDAKDVIDIANYYSSKFRKKYKKSFVYLADEFYLKANMDIPKYESYDDFDQLEDGVGLVAVFDKEFNTSLSRIKENTEISRTITVITGKITEEYIKDKVNRLKCYYPDLNVNVVAPINDYFGENITVTGLVTGQDIINELKKDYIQKNISLGEYLVIPSIMLKEDSEVFLDDTTLTDLKDSLNIKIVVSDGSAKGFIKACTFNVPKKDITRLDINTKRQSYENSIR